METISIFVALRQPFEVRRPRTAADLPRAVWVTGLGPGYQEDLQRLFNARWTTKETGVTDGDESYKFAGTTQLGDALLIDRRNKHNATSERNTFWRSCSSGRV